MKKILSLILAIVMVMTLAAGCSQSNDGGAGSDTIKIGWIGALTGDGAVFGKTESQTIIMLAEELNAKGGVLGKKIEIIAYDTRGDVGEAINATSKLINQDKVSIILGPNASDQAIGMSATLEKGKVAGIATVATNTKVTIDEKGEVKPYNFRVCFIDPYQGAVAAGYAVDKLNFKRAAILYDVASDYSQGLAQYFKETFVAKGGAIVAEEGFKAGDVDFKPQLSKIKDANPDCIFLPCFYKEVSLISKQAREDLGIEATFIGGDALQSAQLMEMAKDAVQGTYVVNHIDYNDPALADLTNRYTTRWPGDKPELNTYLGHDAFFLAIEAIKKANSADSEAIAKAITEVEFDGVTGKIKIDPATHNPLGKEAVMTKIEGDDYIFIERYSAE